MRQLRMAAFSRCQYRRNNISRIHVSFMSILYIHRQFHDLLERTLCFFEKGPLLRKLANKIYLRFFLTFHGCNDLVFNSSKPSIPFIISLLCGHCKKKFCFPHFSENPSPRVHQDELKRLSSLLIPVLSDEGML